MTEIVAILKKTAVFSAQLQLNIKKSGHFITTLQKILPVLMHLICIF